ncbi:hypothetical protein P43SY_007311 [Pythium insidiosum]|uniref:Uncharacterized protein n=1 Tax=Pythium insidiosum TaxID=114742 RepID=A0AAD5LFC7_PYTIN|nr:hypothetical protein P43SY_007311 [Pythium insidiosum]
MASELQDEKNDEREAKDAETKDAGQAVVQRAAAAVERTTYEFCNLSSPMFRLTWLGLLVIHVFCAYFYIISGILYKRTIGSYLEMYLNTYRIAMNTDSYSTVSHIHYVFGVVHLIMASFMVLWSLYRRRFTFGPLVELTVQLPAPSSKVASKTPTGESVERPRRLGRSIGLATKLYSQLLGRGGVLGVEGQYFDHFLTAREVVETTLQTIQAYRMSEYLARPWVNRFYLAILIVNCWSGPLLHSVFRDHKMKRRAMALVFDGVLDLLSATGVSALVMLSLYKDYDYKLGGFPAHLWYDDKWFVSTVSELQILLVSSKADLASRIIFSIGALLCLESIKEVLREVPRSGGPKGAQAAAKPSTETGVTIASESAGSKQRVPRRLRLVSSLMGPEPFRGKRSWWGRLAFQFAHGALIALGVIVLVFHLHAESIDSSHQCAIQVHPWGNRKAACLLLQLDCDHSKHVGESTHVDKEWSVLDPMYTRRLLVTHCSAVEFPPSMQNFSKLMAMKVYNTTISRWEDDAALTATHHPNIVSLIMGRVNITSKVLPPGLLSPDFPRLLTDVSLAHSNLENIPDEMATRWPANAGFGCEVCGFTSIPKGVLGIPNLMWITFAKNPLAKFPVEVFSRPSISIVNLAEIAFPSYQLPDPSVMATNQLSRFYMMETNVTYLPKWVDSYVTKSRSVWYVPPLDLSGSPFCDALAELRAGTRSQFPADWTTGVPTSEVSEFMFLGRANVSALDGLIECASQWTIFYPTADEDQRYS